MCVAKSPQPVQRRKSACPSVHWFVCLSKTRGVDATVTLQYLLAGLGGAQFGIRGEVADDGECGFSGHDVPHASIGRQDA